MSAAPRVTREPSLAGAGRAAAAPLLFGALVGALVAGRLETGLACLLVAAVAAWWVGAPRVHGRWWRVIGVSVVLAFALNLYLDPGRPLPGPHLGRWAPTAEGARLGLLFALRLAGAAVALHGLRAAWPGERAADEIARRMMPLERLRVPVRDARAIVGLAVRFAPLLTEEAERIARLQALRAGRAPRTALEWLERKRAVTVPVFVHALERAEQVALVLEARHYRTRPLPPGAPTGWGWRGAGLVLAGASLVWRGR